MSIMILKIFYTGVTQLESIQWITHVPKAQRWMNYINFNILDEENIHKFITLDVTNSPHNLNNINKIMLHSPFEN